MDTPTNNGSYWNGKTGEHAKILDVRSGPYTKPKAGEIIVRNKAVAINPVDQLMPAIVETGIAYQFVKAPFVLGTDAAGEVVELGPDVTRFKIGDRVVAHALGFAEKVADSRHGAFQEYTVIKAHMATHLPQDMSYEQACVLPLGLSTAATSLYEKGQMGLPLPSLNPTPVGKTFLVWGGSTSVGSNAIQLAKASGYDVIATCSPKNDNYCKSLGATQTFDYNSPTVVKDIVKYLKDKTLGGVISIGDFSMGPCIQIINGSKGDKILGLTKFDIPKEFPKRFVILRFASYFIYHNLGNIIRAKIHGIKTPLVIGDTLAFNEVGPAIYQDFLGPALAQRSFIPAPSPMVVGTGLESLPTAFDVVKKGVSAKKVVVTL